MFAKLLHPAVTRSLFHCNLTSRNGTKAPFQHSASILPRASLRFHADFHQEKHFSPSVVPNPEGSTIKKTGKIGLCLLLGGALLTSIGLSSVDASEHPESTAPSDDFTKISCSIAERICPLVEHYRAGHTTTRPVIAIAGCSGVGKSYFANRLLADLRQMGINAKILHFDDFMDSKPVEGAREDINPYYDYRSAHDFFKKIADGEQVIEKLTWDLTGRKPVKVKEAYDLRGVELLICEGEFTLCDEKTYDFVKFSNVRIALDAKNKDIIDWDWMRARDLETNDFAEFTVLRTASLSKYRTLSEPLTKQYADFLVTKEKNHRYFLIPKTNS